MTLEDFNALTDEEKTAVLTESVKLTEQVNELTAERNSFETENKTLTEQVNKLTEDVSKTKELNYTLSRRLNLDGENEHKDVETLLNEMFMKGKENGH